MSDCNFLADAPTKINEQEELDLTGLDDAELDNVCVLFL